MSGKRIILVCEVCKREFNSHIIDTKQCLDCRVKSQRSMHYLTPKEVAIRLDVNIRTVQGWIRNSTIRAIKIGGRYRISMLDYVEFAKGAKP